jgi:hypothetical protein
VCNILKKWIEVANKPFGSKALDDEEISFGLEERSVMIDLNSIICVLKGNDVIHNVVNIFSRVHVDCFCELHECVMVIVA